MNFDIMKAKTIYRSGIVNKCIQESTDFSDDNNIRFSPVSNEVFKSMREAAANPNYVKITASIPSESDKVSKIYVEAFEFFTYCEAAGRDFNEAAEDITNTCVSEYPEMQNAEFHVVFPSDCMNKNILGGENLGKAVKDDWAMQLIRGCRRYGLKVNIGKEGDYPVADGSDNSKDIEDEGLKEDAGESVIGAIDNLADKAANKIEKEASERKVVMDKIADAKKAVEEYNARNKKKKEEKYKDIKSKEDK